MDRFPEAVVDSLTLEEEMTRLRDRHSEIERRLSELGRHISLTPDEQLERARLKKEKLRSKDRLVMLAQQKLKAA